MKNKKLLYLLIPATLFIWGAIGYTIFSHLNRDNSAEGFDYIPVTVKHSDTTDQSYTLLGKYRDPFIYRSIVPKEKKKEPAKKEQRRVSSRRSNVRKERVLWPDIVYYGVIDNDLSRLALLSVKLKRHIIKAGDIIEELKVVSIYPDSVHIELKGQKKTFKKNNKSSI